MAELTYPLPTTLYGISWQTRSYYTVQLRTAPLTPLVPLRSFAFLDTCRHKFFFRSAVDSVAFRFRATRTRASLCHSIPLRRSLLYHHYTALLTHAFIYYKPHRALHLAWRCVQTRRGFFAF